MRRGAPKLMKIVGIGIGVAVGIRVKRPTAIAKAIPIPIPNLGVFCSTFKAGGGKRNEAKSDGDNSGV
jgi:hypothetical protein